MQFITTVTQKGQATIPAPIRKKLGIKPKGKVYFEMKEKGEVLVKPVVDFLSLRGSLKTNKKPLSNKQMDALIGAAVAKEYATKLKRMK